MRKSGHFSDSAVETAFLPYCRWRPSSGDDQECFPDALIHPVDAQGRSLFDQDEPNAADASGGKSEWRHAKLMLVAGLLGVGLDKLLQRDQQRRNRKLLSIALGSAIIAVLMAGLTIFGVSVTGRSGAPPGRC